MDNTLDIYIETLEQRIAQLESERDKAFSTGLKAAAEYCETHVNPEWGTLLIECAKEMADAIRALKKVEA